MCCIPCHIGIWSGSISSYREALVTQAKQALAVTWSRQLFMSWSLGADCINFGSWFLGKNYERWIADLLWWQRWRQVFAHKRLVLESTCCSSDEIPFGAWGVQQSLHMVRLSTHWSECERLPFPCCSSSFVTWREGSIFFGNWVVWKTLELFFRRSSRLQGGSQLHDPRQNSEWNMLHWLVHAVVANLTRQTMKLILITEWFYLASLEMEISGHNESCCSWDNLFQGRVRWVRRFSFLEVEKRPPQPMGSLFTRPVFNLLCQTQSLASCTTPDKTVSEACCIDWGMLLWPTWHVRLFLLVVKWPALPMESVEVEAYQEGIHANDGQEVKETTGSDRLENQMDSASFFVSVSRRAGFRRLHRVNGCGIKPWACHKVEWIKEVREGCADAACKICKVSLGRGAEAEDSSSSGSSSSTEEEQEVPEPKRDAEFGSDWWAVDCISFMMSMIHFIWPTVEPCLSFFVSGPQFVHLNWSVIVRWSCILFFSSNFTAVLRLGW